MSLSAAAAAESNPALHVSVDDIFKNLALQDMAREEAVHHVAEDAALFSLMLSTVIIQDIAARCSVPVDMIEEVYPWTRGFLPQGICELVHVTSL